MLCNRKKKKQCIEGMINAFNKNMAEYDPRS